MSDQKVQQYESAMPDEYARQWGLAQGTLTQKKPATIRTGKVLGVGGTTLYVVQTFRRIERNEEGRIKKSHDTIFIEIHGTESKRFVLPPDVADVIARQRDGLSTRVRKMSAKQASEKRRAAAKPRSTP